jgi:hypothetical protein
MTICRIGISTLIGIFSFTCPMMRLLSILTLSVVRLELEVHRQYRFSVQLDGLTVF